MPFRSKIFKFAFTKLITIYSIDFNRKDNQGNTLVSEGIEANYQDMINYAVFCLIKLGYHE